MHEKEYDQEDEKFEALLEAKRHDELVTGLKKLTLAITSKDNKDVVQSINKQAERIGNLAKAIQDMPKLENLKSPDVNIELNPKELVSSVQELCNDIIASNNKVIEALDNRLLPESFELVKGYGGITNSVKVNYLPANKLVIKK